MMTKKDYIRAATIVHAQAVSKSERQRTYQAFVAFFRADNPRFDADRFYSACFDGMISARQGTKPRKVLT